ncbi:hypothetical protein B0H14DRAFT_1565397 [Mycena olivaceomarginata]|nr:hypothetical protein B0H14DRAFT_1565397 [Mycena olivaceomarginata]
MGVLSSRIVRDLLVYVFPSVPLLFSRVPFLLPTSRTGRLSRSSVSSTCVLPSQQRCVLAASAHTITLSTSSRLPHIAATHANGWLKSRETTVSRHQILSALFQDHRVPHAAYGTRPIGAILRPFGVHLRRPRSTSPTSHIPSSLYDTRSTASALSAAARLHQPCCRPLCVGKAGAVNRAQRRVRASGARTTCACEPGSIAPIGAPYEL